jgi:hypothetical protein
MPVKSKDIKRALADFSYDPIDDRFMLPVIETIEFDPNYAVLKAKELLAEFLLTGAEDKVYLAVQVLATRKAILDGPIQNKTKKGSRSKDSGRDNKGTSL